jgi:hypothetical protein
VVVVDLPPTAGPHVDAALEAADVLLAVGRCHSAGVRGARAALGLWAAADRHPEAAGAVITGVRSRTPLAPREARALLGGRLWALVPDEAAEFGAAAEDGLLLLDRPDLQACKRWSRWLTGCWPSPSRPADRLAEQAGFDATPAGRHVEPHALSVRGHRLRARTARSIVVAVGPTLASATRDDLAGSGCWPSAPDGLAAGRPPGHTAKRHLAASFTRQPPVGGQR